MRKNKLEYSKRLISDTRWLLWIVTVGGILLAFFCVHRGYTGSLPWIGAMVGLPWTAHGTICSFYLNLAKSDHRVGGITYEVAMAEVAQKNAEATALADVIDCTDSPAI